MLFAIEGTFIKDLKVSRESVYIGKLHFLGFEGIPRMLKLNFVHGALGILYGEK